jgi:hypothetical protein
MKKIIINIDQRKAALTAGIAIVIMTIAAVISNDLSIVKLVVSDDALETWRNITESKMLFRIGVFSWLIVLIADVFAAWGLYLFFKPVNKKLSLLMAWFRLVYVAILGASLMNLIYVLPMINGADNFSSFGIAQLQEQTLFYINAFYDFWAFGLIVFGLHILLLGCLVIKSEFRLKILGILLILAFFGYIIINGSKLLFPQYEDIMYYVGMIFFIPMISEVALGIWLLFIGLKKKIK